MTNNQPKSVAPYRIVAVILMIFQGIFAALMLFGVGESYGRTNSVFNIVNYLIGIFYTKSATAQRNFSRFFIGICFIIFLIYLVKTLIANLHTYSKIKSENDDFRNQNYYARMHSEYGRALFGFVAYLFFTQFFYAYEVNGLTFFVLIAGSALLAASDCMARVLRKGAVLSVGFSLAKSILTFVLVFTLAKYVMKPLFHLYVDGMRALTSGFSASPFYTLYTYLFDTILLTLCVVFFLAFLKAFATRNAFVENADETRHRSKLVMIFAIIILFGTCVAYEVLNTSEQFDFSFDKLKEWLSLTRSTLLPFVLFSISLFVSTLFSPDDAGAALSRKKKAKVEEAAKAAEYVASPEPLPDAANGQETPSAEN